MSHCTSVQTIFFNLADQFHTPVIIMDDFDGHNTLWGSKITNDKGKTPEEFLSYEGLCIYNDGTDTYICILGMGLIQLLILLLMIHIFFKISYGKSMMVSVEVNIFTVFLKA